MIEIKPREIAPYFAVSAYRTSSRHRITLTYNNHTAPEAQQPILLGTSAAWVFVYWPQQRTAEAIPQSGVAHIGYEATR